MPKVSFVISVYNVASYIEKFSHCLFGQTLDDLEFVFVDDASPDDSIAIMRRVLEEYPHRKPQVKVVTHPTNLGCAAANRDSYLAATGGYALLVDPDDYFELDIAEKMYNCAVANDADIVYCQAIVENKQGQQFVLDMTPDSIIGNGENVNYNTICRKIPGYLWCRLVKRALITDNDIIWAEYSFTCDQVVSVQLSHYAKKVASVPEPLYHYCYHAGSVSRSVSIEHRLKLFNEFKYNFSRIEQFLIDKGVYQKYKDDSDINYKAQIKNILLPNIGEPGIRKLWLTTYPEVNKIFLWGNATHKPTYRERIWFIVVALGLYPKLKKVVHSKRLRPRRGWMVPSLSSQE